jgi:hypothetical protein
MSNHPDRATSAQIVLKPLTIIRWVAATAILLILASTAGQVVKFFFGHPTAHGLVRLFYLEEEQNIPTFFSGLLLMTAALLLAVIAILEKKQAHPDAPRWMILAIGFLYMAGDELLSFHEHLMMPVRHLLPWATKGVFSYGWVIPAILVVVALALYFLKFLLRLPTKTRITFLIAATLFVGGAIGGELVEGYYDSLHPGENFVFAMMATVEESLEMAGTTVFIYALLRYISIHYHEVLFRIGDSGSP